MGELHTGQKHPLSGADPKSDFDLHVETPRYQPKREGNWGYMAQNNKAYTRQVGHVSLGQLPN